MRQLVAYAVVRDDPPTVFIAESLDVLHRVLALRLVAQTRSSEVGEGEAELLRELILTEQWGDAVARWIGSTGVPVDVFESLEVWTEAELSAETAELELRFTPLFLAE